MIKFKKYISLVGILLILSFSIYGCSDNNNTNYCKCANCENFINSNNNSTNDINNAEEYNNKNTKDNTIYNENSNSNFNESNITTSESTQNIVTVEQAVNIVKYSNKLKNIQENLRGGEHEVFFRSFGLENIKQNQIKGYSIDALIYNPARNNGEEKIGHFFVSEETGGLFFYDPTFSDYFPVN